MTEGKTASTNARRRRLGTNPVNQWEAGKTQRDPPAQPPKQAETTSSVRGVAARNNVHAPLEGFQSRRLEAELQRLKKLSGLGFELRVVWEPSPDKALSGEVKNNSIYVYEVDAKKAVETLRHEFLDYCISQAIQPYKEVTNMLIRMVNDDAYRRKERIVEALVKLLGAST